MKIFLNYICMYGCLFRGIYIYNMGFPGSSAGKESVCNVGDPSSFPGSRRSPGEGIGYPLQYSCLENPYGQKSLLGYSPWDCNQSDMAEQLSIAYI